MNIFLTGASGFVGQHLLKRLVAEGHRTLALSRSERSDALIRGAGGEPVRGDLEQLEGWPVALQAVDVVIHAAAPVVFWGPWELFEKQVVQATLKLADLAIGAGVRRFIHISTEAVMQDHAPLLDVDESLPYPSRPNSPYGQSKMRAEQALLERSRQMEILIVRPPFVWGPDCPAVGTLLDAVKSGKFRWIDHGRAPFEAVHVENLVEAIRCALTQGRSGGIYLVTDTEKETARQFLQPLLAAHGVTMPDRSVPGWLAAKAAGILEAVWRFSRLPGKPPLIRFEVAFLGQPRRYRTERAREELGYRPVWRRQDALLALARTNSNSPAGG